MPQALANHFDLHPLAVEDCIHLPQRIKADFYGGAFVYCSLTLASLYDPSIPANEGGHGSSRSPVGGRTAVGGGDPAGLAFTPPHLKLHVDRQNSEPPSTSATGLHRLISESVAEVARLTHAVSSRDDKSVGV